MKAAEKKKRNFSIILIPALLLTVFGAITYFSGILYFSGITPCLPPFWVEVDGVSIQKVFAFYDGNQNGIFDEGERPLPNITVKNGDKSARTVEDGKTAIYVFKPGCVCKCSRGDTILVTVPVGWQTTTPTEYLLKGDEDTLFLGFYR